METSFSTVTIRVRTGVCMEEKQGRIPEKIQPTAEQ